MVRNSDQPHALLLDLKGDLYRLAFRFHQFLISIEDRPVTFYGLVPLVLDGNRTLQSQSFAGVIVFAFCAWAFCLSLVIKTDPWAIKS